MDTAAIGRLRCPTCLGELRPQAFAEERIGGTAPRTVMRSGVLLCERCRVWFPVDSDTPVLLRFKTTLHERFADRHRAEIADLAGYTLPPWQPRPGELDVQETFTDQWDVVAEDELSFMYTLDELVALNRRVWLTWLDELPGDQRPASVLDVGCGVGTETIALREVTGAAELFGIDLNFALLRRRPEYRDVAGVHFVVASAFDPPFARESFDLVYSQGVIHHTYSTIDAFDSIAARVTPGGHLFVWVYGLEDHLAPGGASRLSKRANMLAEQVLRPLATRAPGPVRDKLFDGLTTVWHARRKQVERHSEDWERDNTQHALRDWLSPRFARRHGFNEMAEGYEERGFRLVALQSPQAYKELFGRPLWGVGMTGRRTTQALATPALAATGSSSSSVSAQAQQRVRPAAQGHEEARSQLHDGSGGHVRHPE